MEVMSYLTDGTAEVTNSPNIRQAAVMRVKTLGSWDWRMSARSRGGRSDALVHELFQANEIAAGKIFL